MLDKVPEKQMHIVRWLLTIGWIILIFSLFYDPISIHLTHPNNQSSPFSLNLNQCVKIQRECLKQAPYTLGAPLFWGAIVPSSIIILLVFGHEAWRRICPLSFLSQIPRALGWQRQQKVVNPRTGAVRKELAKVAKNSWLARNHLYLQLGLLFIGLNIRLLLVDSHRIALGIFLLLTIFCAIFIGYWYGGKSWCQYFCPMAPVQMIYTGPRGLLGSEAHQGQRQIVTQSMCRTVDKEGNEKSACVSCQSPCLDIDAERSYWDVLDKPGRKLIQYSYLGLAIGFFTYYFLYSGNWDYYYAGVSGRDATQLQSIFRPGFYLFEQPIPIPKLIAAPLTLALFGGASYFLFQQLERNYKAYRQRLNKPLNQHQVLHHTFSIATFIAFNTFFIFGGRPLLGKLPISLQLIFNGSVILVSTLWLYRTLGRSNDAYSRESLADSLRRQLSKLTIDFSRYLEGRSMEDLKPDEVYVLAKVLPSFNREYGLQVYKGMLREALEQGEADSADSLEVLQPVRLGLGLKEEEHFTALTELGIESPDLLNPQKRQSRENQLRLASYRQSLEQQLLKLVETGVPLQVALRQKHKQTSALKREYGITAEEEAQVLAGMFDENSTLLRRAESLVAQLKELAVRYQVLNNLVPNSDAPVFKLLQLVAVQQKQQIVTKQLLSILEILRDAPEAAKIASAIAVLAENVLAELWQGTDGTLAWENRLSAEVVALLRPTESGTMPEVLAVQPATASRQVATIPLGRSPSASATGIPTVLRVAGQLDSKVMPASRLGCAIAVLNELLQELDPLIEAASLYALHQLDAEQGRSSARQLLSVSKPGDWLVRETANNILDPDSAEADAGVQTLIARIAVRGKMEERVFQQPVVRVGCRPMNEIVLLDPNVFEQHALLYLDDQGVSAIELGSPNGLYINEKVIHNDRERLYQGDVIRFGSASEPSITVHWEKRRVHKDTAAKVLGTLDKLLLLFESSFLRTVNPNALIELARDAEVKIYPRGVQLCKAGEPSDEILLLIEGAADVSVIRGDGEHIVGAIHIGETIGEMGVLNRQRRSATVVTTAERNRVLAIKSKNFEMVLRQDSELARNLLLILSDRLQRLTAKVKAQ
ncbi:MAG: cyclic nucleotide-binding domain-containing protein [Kastovskya adunca ATA6-11-RM4]|jgi:hypothetical protein|nr:cyclic nucleotide-binding domain-containing protein [Kastovskya adunca ATA6-11-RM4]